MADVFYTNLVPTTNTPWWSLWKLSRAMVEAGYEIKACGDGSSYSIAGVGPAPNPIVKDSGYDLWKTIPTGSGSGAWICLRNPSLGFDIVFWRSTTSTSDGKIMIGKQGAFVSAGFPSASATNPGTIPSGVGYFRGSAASFVSWFGAGAQPIGKSQIGVRDANGSEAGAFFFLGSTTSYGANTWGQYIQFSKLDPYSSEQGTDSEPYIFFGPNTSTGDWGAYTFNNFSFTSDSTSGNNSYWWGYNYAGTWSQFGGGYITLGASNSTPTDPYSSGTKYWLDNYIIFKEQTGAKERKGITKSIRWTSVSVNQYDTIKSNNYAKFSSGYSDGVVFWDGVTISPSA